MTKKQIIVGAIIGLFIGVVGGLAIFGNSSVEKVEAKASKTNLEWKETSSVMGECFLDDKGKIKQYKTVTYTCQEKSGKDEDCELGATKTETKEESGCDVKRAYCHATESDKNPYVYLFNTAWVEHIRNNGTPQSGHELDFFTWEGDKDCVGFTKVCTDPKATNYDEMVDETEVADNSVCEYPEVTPTPTPTEEPKQETTTSSSSGGSSSASAPQCGYTPPTKVGANFHIYRKGSDAIAKWWPTEGNKANIYFKRVDSPDWQHALRDIDNTGYAEIHDLGNLDITFALQQANECAGGPLTNAVVDGATQGWILFR